MKCKECRKQLLAGPPGSFAQPSQEADVANHLETCEACAQFQQAQQRVAAGLQRLVQETNALPLNEQAEKALSAAFKRNAANNQPARTPSGPLLNFALASALCVLVVGVSLILQGRKQIAPIAPAEQAEATPEQFVAVPYVVPPAPYERTEVVRMQVSLSALEAMGFQVHTAQTGGSVTADVLCGQDGRVVAIALLPDSMIKHEGEVEE
jgi:predicted anti-sigma-YlaC factor YlaD